MMLVQAAASDWKVPASECTVGNGVITHKASGRTHDLRQGCRRRRARSSRPKDVKLKDPKDWKIAGKPLKRLDTADKVSGKTDLRHRHQVARHAQRRDQGLPGVRRQGEELRRRQGREACKGVKKVVPVERLRRRRRRRHVGGSAKTALDALPIEWDEGDERQGLERVDRRHAEGRPRRRAGVRRQQRRRRRRRRSQARPRRSRRSTAIPTRTTPPWSR